MFLDCSFALNTLIVSVPWIIGIISPWRVHDQETLSAIVLVLRAGNTPIPHTNIKQCLILYLLLARPDFWTNAPAVGYFGRHGAYTDIKIWLCIIRWIYCLYMDVVYVSYMHAWNKKNYLRLIFLMEKSGSSSELFVAIAIQLLVVSQQIQAPRRDQLL